MVKLSVSLADIMGDPDLSISSSPFAPGKVIVKRSSFKKGETPAHLEKYLIKKGECKGLMGTVVGPKGAPITKTAACVMEKHSK